MYLQIATLIAIALAALVQFLLPWPWVSAVLLLVAAALVAADVWQQRKLGREIGKLADNFGRSRNHAANLDRHLQLESVLLKPAESNLNTFLSELQSGVGQVRSANIRIAAAVARSVSR